MVRLYVGYARFAAELHKVENPKWGFGDGSAILAYWQRAVIIPAAPARPAITFDWFRWFLQSLIAIQAQSWMGGVVAWGEVLVGVGLIVGGLTGIAAFFGALMNMNFMVAGTASTNPVLFFLAAGLILAWKVAAAPFSYPGTGGRHVDHERRSWHSAGRASAHPRRDGGGRGRRH